MLLFLLHDVNDTVTSITQSTEEGEENSTHTRYTCGVVTELVSGNNKVNYEYDAKRRLSKVKLNEAEYVTITTADATETTDETVHIDYIARSSDDNKSDMYEVTKNKRGDVVSVRYVYDSKTAETPAYAELYTNEYDIKNRLSKVKQGSTVLEENKYDELDRLEEHQFNGHVRTIEYSEYNQRAKETISFGGSGTDKQEYEYAYDDEKASRPQTGMTAGVFGESYEQDALGRSAKIAQTLNGNSYTKRYGYYKQGDHATNRVNTIYYGKNGVTDGKATYTYDGMGNIISVNENGKQRYKYTYDKLNRIISEKDLYKNKEVCYTYDNNGNILTKSIDGEVTEYRYTEGSDRLVQYGTETISYDNMGNPTTYKGLTCTWEKGWQLKSIEDEANRVEYEYDVFGLRKAKKIYEPATAQSPTETTSYIYENGKLLRQVTGGEVMDFYYGSEGVIGFKLSGSTEVANGNYLYRKNLFGDITGIINESGELVYEYAYSAFGKSDKDEETGIGAKNPFRYRGYYYDTETGLYYLKSRYYDPEVGRFITIDDISYLDPDTINGLNLYAYCGNNPVMNVDPNGTFFWALLIGALIAGVISGTFNAINAVRNGGGFLDGLGAFVGGFITGAVIGAAAILGGGLAVGAFTVTVGSIIGTATFLTVGTFAGGFIANITESAIKGERINWNDALNQGALTMFAGITNFAVGYAMGAAGLWNSLKPGNGFKDVIKLSRNAFITEVGRAGVKSIFLGALSYLQANIVSMIARSIIKFIFTKPWKDGISTL